MVAEVGARAVVDVDHGDDSAGGVYVGWDPAPVLRRAGLTAFRAYVHAEEGTHAEERPWVLRHEHVVGEAMTEAMRVILTAGGFTLGDSPTDYAVGMLYVASPPETPLRDTLEGPAPSGGAGPS
jgi:hypothetical protein